MPSTDADSQYVALTSGVGLVDCSDRTQIEVTGEDRAAFLHNLTTAAIRDLQIGQGCEAFVLDIKGHVLGHLLVFCTPETLVLDSVPSQAPRLIAHFERYHIRERVDFHDRGAQLRQWLVAGAGAAALLARLAGIESRGRLSHGAAQFSGQQVWWRHVEFAGPLGFLISGNPPAVAAAVAELSAAGGVSCSPDTLETVRIENRFPKYGVDITDQNLPQEVGRDAQAISFTKGCYLGQETVARIDALGHVNRQLVALRFAGSEIPAAAAELRAGEKPAGAVTSATLSPRFGTPLALAYVRRDFLKPGTRLQSNFGEAEVLDKS
jgi:hypothetical protein